MSASSGVWSVPTVRVALGATAVFTVIQVGATLAPRGLPGAIAVVWSLAMFTIGCVAFGWAFFIAARRSRDERIDLAGVVWLIGVAPPAVARTLRLALAVQVMVAVATAAVRPFSAVAFGILVPMFGLGCLAFYGARHGVFTRPGAGPATPTGSDGSRRSDGTGGTARQETPSETSDVADEPVAESADAAAGEAAKVRPEADRTSDPDDFDQLFRKRRRRRR